MWSVRSLLRRRVVAIALGLAAVLGTVAATRAAMPCVTMMGVVTRLPECCAAMKRTDRIAPPGTDCCQNGRLAEHTPAQSVRPSAPPGPASYTMIPAALALVAPALVAPAQWRTRYAVERPPPLDSPSQGSVILV